MGDPNLPRSDLCVWDERGSWPTRPPATHQFTADTIALLRHNLSAWRFLRLPTPVSTHTIQRVTSCSSSLPHTWTQVPDSPWAALWNRSKQSFSSHSKVLSSCDRWGKGNCKCNQETPPKGNTSSLLEPHLPRCSLLVPPSQCQIGRNPKLHCSSPKVSCPTSTLPPTTINTAKVRTSTPPSTSSYTSHTNHAAKKLLFHQRQIKTKTAERSQIIVADTHCAKKHSPTTKKHWIKKYGLTWHHKKILDSGTKWLDDDLINTSQKVLAKQFKHKFGGAGFQTTANGLCGNSQSKLGNLSKFYTVDQTIGLQSEHVERSTRDCLRQSSLNSFRQHKSPNCKSSLHTRMCNSIKIRECCKPGWRVWLWSFAIAYATTLCLGESPGKYSFNQAQMRNHLKQCLEKEHFTMFPTIKERRHTGNNIKSQVIIPVYCSCRMPAMNPMIECHSCHEWFHVGPCVTVTPKQMKNRNFKWNCTTWSWLIYCTTLLTL